MLAGSWLASQCLAGPSAARPGRRVLQARLASVLRAPASALTAIVQVMMHIEHTETRTDVAGQQGRVCSSSVAVQTWQHRPERAWPGREPHSSSNRKPFYATAASTTCTLPCHSLRHCGSLCDNGLVQHACHVHTPASSAGTISGRCRKQQHRPVQPADQAQLASPFDTLCRRRVWGTPQKRPSTSATCNTGRDSLLQRAALAPRLTAGPSARPAGRPAAAGPAWLLLRWPAWGSAACGRRAGGVPSPLQAGTATAPAAGRRRMAPAQAW